MKQDFIQQKYLLNKNIMNLLRSSTLEPIQMNDDTKGIYLVLFRILNKDKPVIVYSYIYYNPLFFNSLIAYLSYRNINDVYNRNLVIIEDILINSYTDYNLDQNISYKYNTQVNPEKYFLNDSNYVMDLAVQFVTENTNLKDSMYVSKVLDFASSLLYIADSKEISEIFKIMINRDYVSFIDHLLIFIKDRLDLNTITANSNNLSFDLFNTNMFLVNNVKEFVAGLQNLGFDVNQGPQRWRGQVNSMTSLLSVIDHDFREMLFLHHNYHHRNNNLPLDSYLNKGHFTFRNIHMNKGSVRWYSTRKSGNTLSKKLYEKFDQKSFRTDSELYLYLSNFLAKSSTNQDTQRAIEKFLMDYSYLFTNNTKSKTLDFSVFKDPNLKLLVLDSFSILTKYFINFRNKEYKITNKSIKKTLMRSLFKEMLFFLDVKLVVELSLGTFAKVCSNVSETSENCIELDISIDLGETLVKNYLYHLYKSQVKKNVSLFCSRGFEVLSSCKQSFNEVESAFILSNLTYLEKNLNKLEVYELFRLLKKILTIEKLSNYQLNETITSYTFSDWKRENEILVLKYEDNSDLYLHIGSLIIEWLFDCDLIQSKLVNQGSKAINKRVKYLTPSERVIKLLPKSLAAQINYLPLKIPMIVKPQQYKREIVNNKVIERLGGYLLNDESVTDKMIIPNWQLREGSSIDKENVVYDLVNNISSVAYKINTDLLEFINLYSDKYSLLLNDLEFKSENTKLTSNQFNELQSYISKVNLQENILGLAKVFSNVPEFYLPVRLDFRGRVNCISQYLNYQSTELAKSLLLFSKGEKLMKNDIVGINYLKSYGANCYGNKLDKKSWVDRCKWIDKNESDIINFTNGVLIEKAESKLLFIAFCIEYNKWLQAYNDSNISYFITHLPTQFDATCNGYQHLALLTYDYDMAKELNLTKSTNKDNPKDFYSFMIDKLLELLEKKSTLVDKYNSKDILSYKRLSESVLSRTSVKKALMTIPYNVSIHQMIQYIKEHFEVKEGYVPKEDYSAYTPRYIYKDNTNIIFSDKDITHLALGLREVLDRYFPKLKLLILYLQDIARICTELDLVITWQTPSGMLLNQSYKTVKGIKVKPYSYNKGSFTINVTTNELDVNKQVTSLMPNLIHSLDASVLALLTDTMFKSRSDMYNFYSIHDCFAVTANNVKMLFDGLKTIYTNIYTEDQYLRNFDNFIRLFIKITYGDFSFNDGTLSVNVLKTVKGKEKEITLKFPDINYVLGTKLPTIDLIKGSSYIIN